MAAFEVVRHTALEPLEAWRRLTDWGRHGDFVPFTKVRVTQADAGETLIARTGLGPFGFDDTMLVSYALPPTEKRAGIARLVKTGRVVLGWAVLTVSPEPKSADGPGGSVVSWYEEARLRGTGGPVAAAVGLVAKQGFARLIDGLLATPSSPDAS